MERESIAGRTRTRGRSTYLRRDGDRAVLVIANLRTTAASGVALLSEDAVLAPGTDSAAGLLGGGVGTSLSVGANGRITSYVPLGSVPPLTARLVELVRVPRWDGTPRIPHLTLGSHRITCFGRFG